MNVSHIVIGLMVGIAIGAMDFSLAKSVTSIMRVAKPQVGRAIIVLGFMFRLGAIAILLWTIARADNISFLATCVGLTGTFTLLTVRQAAGLLTNTGLAQKKGADDRR